MHFQRWSLAALSGTVIACAPNWATQRVDAGPDAGDVQDAETDLPEQGSDGATDEGDEDAGGISRVDGGEAAIADPGTPRMDGGDGSVASAADAADLEQRDSAPPMVVDDAGMEAATVEPPRCTLTACENGGTCAEEPNGLRCSCPAPFMGDRCEVETKTCTTMFLRTPEDLAKAQVCSEIQGNLTVTSAGIPSITESDLPYLTKITGHFSMSGLANNLVETPRLRELTLAKLTEIGGALTVSQTGAGSVIEIRFPVLTRVGKGVVVEGTETTRLELPALRAIEEGGLYLTGLKQLCRLEIGAIEQISGQLKMIDIFNIPASTLEPLRSAFSDTPTAENRIGCCLPIDKTCPERFTIEDRESFCGCSSP